MLATDVPSLHTQREMGVHSILITPFPYHSPQNFFKRIEMFRFHPAQGSRLTHSSCTRAVGPRSVIRLSVMTTVIRCFPLIFMPTFYS